MPARSKVRTGLLLCLLVLGAGCGGKTGEPVDRSAEVLAAVQRSLDWLEANPTKPGTHSPRMQTLDALAWFLISISHPDETTRAHTGRVLEQRLNAIPAPAREDAVGLTYVALALRMKQHRGLDLSRDHAALADTDVTGLLGELAPGTAWWTAELMRRTGRAIESDFSETFIANTTKLNEKDFAPERRDAVIVFHELVPAVDFGFSEPSVIGDRQLAFLQRAVPGLIEAARQSGDTDALAEALVTAVLLDRGGSEFHARGLATLLARQNNDGTYASNRDQPEANADYYRHVVAVASWALLISLDD